MSTFPSLPWIILEIAIVGTAAFGSAWLIEKFKRRGSFVVPENGAILRLSTGACLFRTRFIGPEAQTWKLDPPVGRSECDQLKVGVSVIGEFTSSNGLVRFRSEVVKIDLTGHLQVRRPLQTLLTDRREEPRLKKNGPLTIERSVSEFVDVGPLGGCFKTDYTARKGERIRLDFPHYPEPVFGWVLEANARRIRVRFEERIPTP